MIFSDWNILDSRKIPNAMYTTFATIVIAKFTIDKFKANIPLNICTLL